MGLFDRFFEKQVQNATKDLAVQVTSEVVSHVDKSLSKAQETIEKAQASIGLSGVPTTGIKRYQFSQDMVNGGIQRKTKPGGNISFETMRRFSISHEVTRACINLRKRQIAGLEWKIVSADDSDVADYSTQEQEVVSFFKTIGGRNNNYRHFMDRVIEDLMVLDAIALEKQKNRGGGLAGLIPIDAATIRLRVDENGATPEPPETAYVQVIRGQVTAEMTDDEMIYEMMNPRNDTPYGLSPLESLMIIVTSSLKAGMYNLAYLTDGNTPEGIFTMPDTWNPQQIKEFQEYFDAYMSGDEAKQRKMKFMPPGTFTNTNNPKDMAFAEFNDWLMKITCALFEVTPMEIGFSPKAGLGGKGFSEEQGEVAEKKGVMPMAKFIEEIFTKIIQEDLGYPNLKFVYSGLIEHDEKSVAELNAILINSGQRTVNEVRTDEGLDPIEGLNKPFVQGQVTFLDQESQDAAANAKANLQQQLQNPAANGQEEDQTKQAPAETTGKPNGVGKRDTTLSHDRALTLRRQQAEELRTFRKYAVNRMKANKPIRPFISKVLPLDTLDELNIAVAKMTTPQELREVFNEHVREFETMALDEALEARNELLELA